MPDGEICQSPVGPRSIELPKGWRWVRLADHVSKIGSGLTPLGGQAAYASEGIPFIRSQNVHMNSFSSDGLAFITPEQDLAMAGSRVIPKDVLLNITGASIGRVCVVPDAFCPANVNQHVCIIRCEEDLYPEYFSFYISTPEFQRWMMGSQAGATRQALTKRMIEDFTIPLPPLIVQRKIAALVNQGLSVVERARAALQAQLEAARALFAAHLRRSFPQVGQELPPKWRWATLGELILEDGQYGLSMRASYIDEGIPILRMGNIDDGSIRWDDLRYLLVGKEEVRSYLLEKGDLLVNRTNSAELVGKSAVVDCTRDAVFASYLVRFKIDPAKGDPHFISRFINSASGRVFIEQNLARAIGQANISASKMKKMPIPLPSLPEQKRISELLERQMDSAGRFRKVLESQLTSLDALPAALLRKAFSGEL